MGLKNEWVATSRESRADWGSIVLGNISAKKNRNNRLRRWISSESRRAVCKYGVGHPACQCLDSSGVDMASLWR